MFPGTPGKNPSDGAAKLSGMDPKVVHRQLDKGDKGPDATQVQHGINRKARAWKLEQFLVETDGQVGRHTLKAASHLLYAMGVSGEPLRRARNGELSQFAQRLLRSSRRRTAAMKALALVRKPRVQRWRRQGLAERAYQVAVSLIGVMEEGGNNTGKKVSEIIQSNGGVVGESWCGDFQAFCYRLAGSKAVTRGWAVVRWLGGIAGLKIVSTPRRGDLVRFTFDHVGMFEKDNGDGTITTIEGNTGASGAVSDSSTGGDGVYRKIRDKSLVSDYVRVTR